MHAGCVAQIMVNPRRYLYRARHPYNPYAAAIDSPRVDDDGRDSLLNDPSVPTRPAAPACRVSTRFAPRFSSKQCHTTMPRLSSGSSGCLTAAACWSPCAGGCLPLRAPLVVEAEGLGDAFSSSWAASLDATEKSPRQNEWSESGQSSVRETLGWWEQWGFRQELPSPGTLKLGPSYRGWH